MEPVRKKINGMAHSGVENFSEMCAVSPQPKPTINHESSLYTSVGGGSAILLLVVTLICIECGVFDPRPKVSSFFFLNALDLCLSFFSFEFLFEYFLGKKEKG